MLYFHMGTFGFRSYAFAGVRKLQVAGAVVAILLWVLRNHHPEMWWGRWTMDPSRSLNCSLPPSALFSTLEMRKKKKGGGGEDKRSVSLGSSCCLRGVSAREAQAWLKFVLAPAVLVKELVQRDVIYARDEASAVL